MTVSESAEYYDQIAATYRACYRAQSPGGYALWVRQQRVLELLDGRGGKVLDVGCGPGVLARELVNRGYETWGLDASPKMIEHCRRDIGERRDANFVVGDAAHLVFADGSFDAVICMGVIGSIGAGEAAIKEMIRVLKPNGSLLISFPNLLSPYAAWRAFVFYPTVALIRPVYYSLVGRPAPPAVYNLSWCRQLRSRGVFHGILDTAGRTRKLMAKDGVEVTDIVYFYFNVLLSPIDELLGRPALALSKSLERLRFGRLKWLGAGFVVKARKLG